MKKIFYLILTSVALLASCKKPLPVETQFSLSEETLNFEAAAASFELQVTANKSWKVNGVESWLTVTPDKGDGDAVVSVSVKANEGESPRSVLLKFVCAEVVKRLNVIQAEPSSIVLSTKELTFSAKGATESEIKVSSESPWTAKADDDWIIISQTSGDGDAVVKVCVSDQDSAEGRRSESRTGTISFTCGKKTVTATVRQLEETVIFEGDKNEAAISSRGGAVVVILTHNTSYQVSVPATASWISHLSSRSAVESEVILAVQPNTGSAAREASVDIIPASGSKFSVKISQTAGDADVKLGGSGTVASPYLISNLEELVFFAQKVNDQASYDQYSDKAYKLTADIDAAPALNFVPAGNNELRPFKGVFDGDGHKIKGLHVRNTETHASGLFGYIDGAELKNFTLEKVSVNSDYIYTGAVAGMSRNSKISNVNIVGGQVRAYQSGISVSACDYAPITSANAGYCGGMVGLLYKSTLESCTFDANATFYGKFCGGMVGMSFESKISGCHLSKDSVLNVYYHYNGGLVGRAMGASNVIENSSYEGKLNCTGYCSGGIVGELLGGKVTGCVCGSHGFVGSDKNFVAGIAGAVVPKDPTEITNCASYGHCRGAYGVAGIAGYVGAGTTSDKDLALSYSSSALISNCAFIGGILTGTQGNSSKYPIVGGIVGWSHGSASYNPKYNLQSCYSLPGLIETTYGDNVNAVLSGVSAYQNNPDNSTIENCYSAFELKDMLVCGSQMTNESLWYAAVAIRCTGQTTLRNCFSSNSLRTVYTSSGATVTGCEQLSVEEMTNGTLLGKLNATAPAGVQWVAGANGYPTFSNLPADPNPKQAAKKKISVIGDSISTFKGWIPGGYSAHYPATDGTLTLVNETYWYRLAHDHMKDAEIDVNIAFSGSTVTNTTAENYAARYGSATNAWWHNSYSERFAACGGCGNPDIILIHGGTNDWSHNADPLAPGVAIRNEAGNIYGGRAPVESIMNSMFSVADAAKTRSEVNALPDGTFCEAYIKLLCQIRERYPRCKVVCIIGDYLNQAIEQSVLQIAEHYGAKTVNLFRVNGFNDLGGYQEGKLPGLGQPQPNMPKHDHTDLNSTIGCHPGSACMDFMASKIYSELGAWLEQ